MLPGAVGRDFVVGPKYRHNFSREPTSRFVFKCALQNCVAGLPLLAEAFLIQQDTISSAAFLRWHQRTVLGGVCVVSSADRGVVSSDTQRRIAFKNFEFASTRRPFNFFVEKHGSSLTVHGADDRESNTVFAQMSVRSAYEYEDGLVVVLQCCSACCVSSTFW